MALFEPAPSSVEVNRREKGYFYIVHFKGTQSRETGPFKTEAQAMAAGNRDLARLEASDRR